MKSNILSILTNPFTLSLIIAITVLYFIHPAFPKYIAEIQKRDRVYPNHAKFYEDLDNDGNSEEISVEKGYNNGVSIIIRKKAILVNQWSFKGNLMMNRFFFGDFDNNNIKEIYLFTLDENNILFHCFDPISNKKIVENKIIDYFYSKNGVNKFSIESFQLADVNGDLFKELVFPIHVGFPIHPRRLYSFDFISDSLNKSESSCIPPFNLQIINPENKDEPLFLVSTAAVGNCDSTLPLTDHYSWLTVFNKDLTYKFEPVRIGYYPSGLLVSPYKFEKTQYLLVLNIYEGNQDYSCSMSLFDLNGKLIKETTFKFSPEWKSVRLLNSNNNQYIIRSNGNIDKIDENLNYHTVSTLSHSLNQVSFKLDCDDDGQDEFLFQHQKLEKITIVRNDFLDPVEIDVTGNTSLYNVDLVKEDDEEPLLYIGMDTYSYVVDYRKNPYYTYRFFVYGLLYLGILLFLFLLQKAQSYRTEQKIKAEKEIAELQMRSIKNQIDPHFTLNIINSIGSLFAKHDTEKANYVFGKYSKLLRNTVLHSDQIVSSLNDELDYVENYLALEQIRNKHSFDFNINVTDNVDVNINIPKMLFHSFVENSVKHGIRHLDKTGLVEINIRNEKKYYLVKITDNGIGRRKAKEYSSFSTGKGILIIDQLLELYKNLKKIQITYEIEDLLDNENVSVGTEVRIRIPILKN